MSCKRKVLLIGIGLVGAYAFLSAVAQAVRISILVANDPNLD
jgi:hypothetical protein